LEATRGRKVKGERAMQAEIYLASQDRAWSASVGGGAKNRTDLHEHTTTAVDGAVGIEGVPYIEDRRRVVIGPVTNNAVVRARLSSTLAFFSESRTASASMVRGNQNSALVCPGTVTARPGAAKGSGHPV
jgi:hypothetical protein